MLQSPEKLQARLEEIQRAVERERQATGEGERRARDLQARLDAVAKVGVCCLLSAGQPECNGVASNKCQGQLGRSPGGHVLLAGQSLGWRLPIYSRCAPEVRTGGMHPQVEAGSTTSEGCTRQNRQTVAKLS